MTTTAFRVFVLAVTVLPGIACTKSWIGAPSPDGDPGPPINDAGGPVVDRATLEKQIMARWNAVADGGTSSINFHWDVFEQFPHPTYKGGTAEGYGEFAEVLAAFFERDDNFDFLERNELFETPLLYVFPSGQEGLRTSFEELAIYFSSDTAFGDIASATRVRLQTAAARIRESLS
jgi:hypothetical protein